MKNKKPHVLITNDDGIFAPGIKHLWQAVHNFAHVTIVAPSSEKSASGLSTTILYPLHIIPEKWEKETLAYSINGTPADCVKMALSVILDKMPDMIISGINRGSNAGRNVLYSGTIGGVIEGVLRNIPGIAFSCEDLIEPDYKTTEKYIFPIIEHFLKNSLPLGSFVNVSFPKKEHAIKGIKLATQGKGHWIEDPDRRKHPAGHEYCWIRGLWKDQEEIATSDVALLKQGYITAVPIQIHELTNSSFFTAHQNKLEESLKPLFI